MMKSWESGGRDMRTNVFAGNKLSMSQRNGIDEMHIMSALTGSREKARTMIKPIENFSPSVVNLELNF